MLRRTTLVVLTLLLACGDDDSIVIPQEDGGRMPPPEVLPETCDPAQPLVLGEREPFFLGECGSTERTFELASDTGISLRANIDPALLTNMTIARADQAPSESEAFVEGVLEHRFSLPAGDYVLRFETEEEMEASGTALLEDSCSNRTMLEFDTPESGTLEDGDCLSPDRSDLWTIGVAREGRILIELNEGDAEIELLDEELGLVAGGGEGTIDETLAPGRYLVRVFSPTSADTSYTLLASELDACAPFETELGATVTGTLDGEDCANGALRSDRYSFLSPGFQLVRAEWAARDGSDNPGDHVNEIPGEIVGSSVTYARGAENGDVVASWIGVIEPGTQVWSLGRLFEGAIPAGGTSYAGAVAVPPAPGCTEHINQAPIVDDTLLDEQRLWDCTEGSRNITVRSITVARNTTIGIGAAAPDAEGGVNIELRRVSGEVVQRGFAFQDQAASFVTAIPPGMYWLVALGTDRVATHQISVNFMR